MQPHAPKTMTKVCLLCKETFSAEIKEVRRGNAKYCSRACSGRARSAMSQEKRNLCQDNCSCARCGKSFYRTNSKMRNSKHMLQFCSRTCKNLSQRLGGITELHPPHYGSGTGAFRYREILADVRPLTSCERCGFNRVLEIIQVHHIDRNHDNNDPVNLVWLCPNCHEEDHFKAGDGRWAKTKLAKLVLSQLS